MSTIVCSAGMELPEDDREPKPGRISKKCRRVLGRAKESCAYRLYFLFGLDRSESAFNRAKQRDVELPGLVVERVLDAVARLFDPALGGFKAFFEHKLEWAIRSAIEKQSNRSKRFQLWSEEIVLHNAAPTPVEIPRLWEILDEALSTLEPIERQVIEMKYGDGLGYSTIAAYLLITKSNARVIAWRSRRKLRPLIRRLLDGERND